MRPVLIVWRGRSIHAYPVFLGAGVAVFIEALVAKAPADGLPTWPVLLFGATLATAALAGARLLYVATNWDRFARSLGRIARREGGAAVLGGVVVALILAPLLAIAFELPLGRVLDGVAIAALPGVAVGRIGCLLHGCCLGARKRPVPAFESVLALALLVALLLAPPLPSGATFLLGVTGYAAIHFSLHFLRPRERRVVGLATMQLLAIAVCVVCITVLMVMLA